LISLLGDVNNRTLVQLFTSVNKVDFDFISKFLSIDFFYHSKGNRTVFSMLIYGFLGFKIDFFYHKKEAVTEIRHSLF